MTKIDKKDLDNINFLKKELKFKDIQTIKIKKGNYEIEISSKVKVDSQKTTKETSDKDLNLEKNLETRKIKPENIVKSPMVGVAYLSPDPESPPFIKVGQHVKQGDILILIEAMKTFNEVKAPKSGIIKEIVVLNSQPVEYGDEIIIFE
tara:strand:+ start:2896 stop:3342 length:447 start_codon:yes stop_codon:yes gene_type:complete